MKIWCQTVSSMDKRPQIKKEFMEIISRAVDPGTEFVLHGTRTGIGGEEYGSVRYMDIVGVLSNAIAAERQGFDAFAIINSLDAGLRETRELVNIPVVGAMQTTLMMVSMMGSNFSLITTHPKFAVVLNQLVRDYGFGDRLVSINSLDVPMLSHDRLWTDKEFGDIRAQRAIDICKKAVAAGAETIVVMPLSIYLSLSKRGVTEIDGAPIVDPTTAVIKMTELMVKYRQRTGTFISRKLTYASPPKELVDQLVSRHNLQIGE